ncbi:hypothetical protein SD961_21525 [Erwinia sp. MMLR14_017]|uniref:hypothetical protein n=1 Tax=Erwinia sp. MMLR14_017 TaxID=3093842 RepID=UPI00299037C0|nr:hypothetical protein [Erwinia sp. MMLR14_017]MDW8848433.1 hypothetical protein [Erwinia sp. MMLR14_017]
MQNKKIKLLFLLVSLWIVGLFIILVGGRVLISLASYFLVGDFDFYRNDLIRGAEISIGCGIIIGVGQCLMSKEKTASPSNPK